MALRCELLESRRLLAASDPFAWFVGTLDGPGMNESAIVRISPEEVAASGGEFNLGFIS